MIPIAGLAANSPAKGAKHPAESQSASIVSQIDAMLQAAFAKDAPGAAVIVSKNGQVLFRKAYGMANLAQKQAMQADSVFRLGSLTKQFTAVAIMQLVEAGKLTLDEDIHQYLPDYPTGGKRVTIAHLLTHTAGIPNFTSIKGFDEMANKPVSAAQMMAFFGQPLEFDPGTSWNYSNSGYYLLGLIIEKVSGQTYADYLAQHIFEPLAMDHTAYEGQERAKGAVHVPGYQHFGPSSGTVLPINMAIPFAAGGLVSNVDDLARWDNAITAGQLLKQVSWQQLLTESTLSTGKRTGYGLGWFVGTLHGHAMVEHGGSIPGFKTHALRLPQDRVFVAILTNASNSPRDPGFISQKIAMLVVGQSMQGR